jgi:hypothetical protein
MASMSTCGASTCAFTLRHAALWLPSSGFCFLLLLSALERAFVPEA